LRRWIFWLVIGVWVGTGLLIFILTQIQPRALANVSLLVRQVSFKTNAKEILSRINAQELVISRISSLEIHGKQALNISVNNHPVPKAVSLRVDGKSPASCSFDKVTGSGLMLSDPSLVTLIWPGKKNSFGITFHGWIKGSLTSQPGAGVTCRNVEIDGKSVETVDVEFSLSGGDSVNFTTVTDGRFDFRDLDSLLVDDSQIPISGPIQVLSVGPGADPAEPKTVLLAPKAGEKNRITFDGIGKEIILDNADLLVIVPDNDFYLREFKVDDGILLNLHGVINEIRIGAGAKDLRSAMPSLFDHIDARSRVLGVIPAIVALLIGVLEKMKVLPAR
jgi:hypothetical protein